MGDGIELLDPLFRGKVRGIPVEIMALFNGLVEDLLEGALHPLELLDFIAERLLLL